MLRPTLRLVDNSNIGHLSGTVDPLLLATKDCSPAIYLHQYTPPVESEPFFWPVADDIHPDNHELITTTYPVYNKESGIDQYEIGFIPEGDYFVAFTCSAIDDDPAENDDINFHLSQPIEIKAGQETIHNITAPQLP